MEKKVIFSASYYTQKYYSNPEFDGIPTAIRNEIRMICISLAEKLHTIFTIGFYENGEIYFEARSEESDYDFDEIGVPLEIKKLETEESELLKKLRIWYRIYKSPEGETIKNIILNEAANKKNNN
jgi:(p)ppGpp synthase/HD superfamily hydrolase